MKNLIDRIAGVGFSLALTLTDDGDNAAEIVASDYSWTLRGKKSDAAGEGDPIAFELTTAGGQITVEDGEVVCAFSAAATESLAGLYRAQLVGSSGGQATLGAEIDPIRFMPRY